METSHLNQFQKEYNDYLDKTAGINYHEMPENLDLVQHISKKEADIMADGDGSCDKCGGELIWGDSVDPEVRTPLTCLKCGEVY